jgi:predicted O-methyltransferase YrrM
MLNNIFRVSDYIQYLITASGRHGVHSPFVYDFIETVLQPRLKVEQFHLIELARKNMLRSSAKIEFEDFGGGKKSGLRGVSQLAGNTARQAKYGHLLFKIIRRYNYSRCLELGTGTGITALYQAMALQGEFPLLTIEGSKSVAEIAQFNANFCGLESKIQIVTGEFNKTLPNALQAMQQIDLAYIDGNHRKEPTIDYFEKILPHIHNNGMMIFDDINWSEEMKQAWHFIKMHDAVTVSIDLYNFGIVLFRKEQQKEHFTLRY